jgi:hypothetical protein
MEAITTDTAFLRNAIIDDIFRGLGTSAEGLPRRIMWPVVWPPAHKFSLLAARFDKFVENSGNIRDAMQDLLPNFVSDVEVSGSEVIPQDGPLLVVSNHPGTFDEVVIASNIPRKDLKIVAGGFPFLRNLQHTREHLIFISQNFGERMAVVREIINHLENGFSLLLFPSGMVEPDPAVLPGAVDSLNRWSRSLDLILRRVPQTQVQVAIISGVLSPSVLKHPISRLFQDISQKQRVAEGIQIIQQLFKPQKYNLVPNLTFEIPFDLADISSSKFDRSLVLNSVIQRAKSMLESHAHFL